MRYLRLRDDAYYAPTPDGLYVLGHEGTQLLPGDSISQWLERLRPYLEGRHTEEELTADLAPDRKDAVWRVLKVLRERGMLVETREPAGTADVGDVADDPDTRYVGYFRDDFADAVARYREGEVALIGSGPLVAAVARAARVAGLSRIRVHDLAAGAPTGTTGLDAQLIGDADIVMQVADDTGRPGVVAHAVVEGAELWLGSAAEPHGDGDAAAGWADGWLRRKALPRDDQADARAPWTPPALATTLGYLVAANQLIHWIFGQLTGTVPEDLDTRGADHSLAPRGRMICVDLHTLRSSAHTFVPHPFTRSALPRGAAETQARVTELGRSQWLDDETFSQRAAAVVDTRTGVMRLAERELAQVPMHVCEVQVSDPVGLLGAECSIPAAGPDFATARYRAALRGFATYCSLMVDPRRLFTSDGVTPLCAPRTDPVPVLAALRDGRLQGTLWGIDLADSSPRLVDAVEVFPALRADGPHPLPTGVAAGLGWQEAVQQALVDNCVRLTVAEISSADRPFSRLALDDVVLDEVGDRYRSLWAAIGEPLKVYDVTGSCGIPTLAFCVGPDTVAYAGGTTIPEAVREGLAQVLLSYQARTHGQPAYAPPPVRTLPHDVRGATFDAEPARPASTASEGAGDPGAVARGLSERGLRAIGVPLDHDPAVTAVLPYVVHVVVARD